MQLRGTNEIISSNERQSAITSHSIGVSELARLLEVVPPCSDLDDYEQAAVKDNALGLSTASGRHWRFATLRRLFLLRPDSVLFRALRDLWAADDVGRPLLVALMAMATDTVFRASSAVITSSVAGDDIEVTDFSDAIASAYPGAYAESTLRKAASNAYASWQQSGHLGPPEGGSKVRQAAVCGPTDVAYALLLGYLQDRRGEALFATDGSRDASFAGCGC